MKRIFLLAGTIGWGVSILGVLLPWSVMDIVLQNMGAASPITDVQVQYCSSGWQQQLGVLSAFCI